jgi:xanthine/uracil permease
MLGIVILLFPSIYVTGIRTFKTEGRNVIFRNSSCASFEMVVGIP